MFALKPHTLVLTVAGSHAHGTHQPSSDLDLRGVCVAPRSLRLSLSRTFEQHTGVLPDDLVETVQATLQSRGTPVPPESMECVIFDIAKFLKLCAAANPNTLEILFADPSDWLIASPGWRTLYDRRQVFLTKRVQKSFSGYGLAQLRRIQTHRGWLLKPPQTQPTRRDFGLPDATVLSRDQQGRIERGIADKIESYGVGDLGLDPTTRATVEARMSQFYLDALQTSTDALDPSMRAVATRALNLSPELTNTLTAEKRYRAAKREWRAYQSWKAHRNRARADLERAHGFDTKHAMHLVRLLRMGLEVLRGEGVQVRRPDTEDLCAIRSGAWTFDKVLSHAEDLHGQMTAAAEVSALPEEVDPDLVDAMLLEVLDAFDGSPGA